ncbi:hypothetical protein LXL04_039765 [Taraxacum kok-saghyz]
MVLFLQVCEERTLYRFVGCTGLSFSTHILKAFGFLFTGLPFSTHFLLISLWRKFIRKICVEKGMKFSGVSFPGISLEDGPAIVGTNILFFSQGDRFVPEDVSELSVNIMDRTGSIWVTTFQESGEERTGVSAKELRFMKYEEGDEERFTTTIRNLCELSVNIMDHTGSIWVTAFQESREDRTGVSAKELDFMKYNEGAKERFTRTIRNVIHSWFNFKLKVKEESYNDESRVKSTVVKAEQVKL